MQDIGFDIISDLNLDETENFSWEDKVTSLYCIVAGNISSQLDIVYDVLVHLSTLYQGVFFVPGKLEYDIIDMTLSKRTEQMSMLVEGIPNVCMLHQHVAVIDGIAVVGANGWEDIDDQINLETIIMTAARLEDCTYLRKTIAKLQRHLDIKKIIMVSSAVPHEGLYFNEKNPSKNNQLPLCECLDADTEKKVSHWIFGTHKKLVETCIGNIKYVNNPRTEGMPYWAKRIVVSI